MLNNFDKAGIIFGVIGSVAGIGMAIYANKQCKKVIKEIEEFKTEDPSEIVDRALREAARIDRMKDELFGNED